MCVWHFNWQARTCQATEKLLAWLKQHASGSNLHWKKNEAIQLANLRTSKHYMYQVPIISSLENMHKTLWQGILLNCRTYSHFSWSFVFCCKWFGLSLFPTWVYFFVVVLQHTPRVLQSHLFPPGQTGTSWICDKI